MTEETETIKPVDRERIAEVFDRLEGFPEDVQTVFDLTFVALVCAEIHGLELSSFYEIISRQQPLAKKFTEKLIEEQ